MAVHELTPEERAKESSILLAVVLDALMLSAFTLTGLLGGSLTIVAEALRGALGYALDLFSFVLLKRIHRGVLGDMEYGAGKLEQVANLLIGAGMLIASGWILTGVVKLATGERALATPLGLACAAILGMVNVYVNLLAWDSVRRSAGVDSLIMQAQLTLRWVRLLTSVVVVLGLTIAALSTDDVIVAFCDGAASLFVACYLGANSIAVLRSTMPDLLDRSAGAKVREAMAGALARHADVYARVMRSRSRRSGQAIFIEIALAFDPALSIAEVDRRAGAIQGTIREALPGAEVAIVASSDPRGEEDSLSPSAGSSAAR